MVKVLPQAVPAVTPDGARELFHASRENGLAVVIVTVKVLIFTWCRKVYASICYCISGFWY